MPVQGARKSRFVFSPTQPPPSPTPPPRTKRIRRRGPRHRTPPTRCPPSFCVRVRAARDDDDVVDDDAAQLSANVRLSAHHARYALPSAECCMSCPVHHHRIITIHAHTHTLRLRACHILPGRTPSRQQHDVSFLMRASQRLPACCPAVRPVCARQSHLHACTRVPTGSRRLKVARSPCAHKSPAPGGDGRMCAAVLTNFCQLSVFSGSHLCMCAVCV